MKRAFKAGLFTFAVVFPLAALAQAVTGTPASPPVDMSALLNQLMGTVSSWRAGGWIAGCAALVSFFVNVSKYPPVAEFLEKSKIGWWLRPVIAVVLGVVAAVFSNLVGGVPVGTTVLIALLSGLGSTGFHELMVAIFDSRVKAERAAGAKIVEALQKADGVAAVAVVPAIEQLTMISAIPGADARVKALADWAKTNEPKA